MIFKWFSTNVPPATVSHKEASDSLDLTLRWAERARKAKKTNGLLQFGIVQGAVYADLREKSAKALVDIGFDGYAIGGLSVGESKEDMRAMTEASCAVFPMIMHVTLWGLVRHWTLLNLWLLGLICLIVSCQPVMQETAVFSPAKAR